MSSTPPQFNPVVGPIYIEGVERGDVIVVEIQTIAPWRWGYVGIVPGNGALRDSYKWGPACRDAHIRLIEHIRGPSGTTADGIARYGSLEWKLDSFLHARRSTGPRSAFFSNWPRRVLRQYRLPRYQRWAQDHDQQLP